MACVAAQPVRELLRAIAQSQVNNAASPPFYAKGRSRSRGNAGNPGRKDIMFSNLPPLRPAVPLAFGGPAPNTAGMRAASVCLAVAAAALFAWLVPPVVQDPAYHAFADRRPWLGLPNALDVLSNVPFLVAGLAGLAAVRRRRDIVHRAAWNTLFAGICLVAFGSAWYHLDPGDASLVWDRLPMTVGFMGFAAAFVAEQVALRRSLPLLLALVAAGIASVIYWQYFDDLRWYGLVQFLPLLLVLVLLLRLRPRFDRRDLLLAALAAYAVAKVFEYFDHGVFALTAGIVSGHTLKHLAAAAGCFLLVRYVALRRAAPQEPVGAPGVAT